MSRYRVTPLQPAITKLGYATGPERHVTADKAEVTPAGDLVFTRDGKVVEGYGTGQWSAFAEIPVHA